ncbi:MAG: hypothetical protein ACI379_15640 [Nocardioides sp.]|uniref:hypothetical protein n=1 Tax=Nocardioides sp. TaxID=35761 RepID=UPI003F00FEDC
MTRRVILHVGTPKTGTSHLQDVLYRNRDVLREHGILYPADRFDAHFLAALDLMKLTWGGLESEAVGAWTQLAARVRDWPGTSIISHEIFATATPTQVAYALESLGEDAEVHLVLSVRDLVRQIPAEWQENVKHRSHVTYKRFLEQLTDPARDSRIGSWFWGVQELPDILDRWGAGLPPEHVHLVTVPPSGAPRDELWRRFSVVFGLDGIDLDATAERANASMGVPETTLMRQLNQRVSKVVAPADYRPLVRELLAHQTFSERTGSPRLALPPAAHERVQAISTEWVAELSTRGYSVEGDLKDLIGGEPTPYTDPDTVSDADLYEPAMDAIAALLVEASRLRASEARLADELRFARIELEGGGKSRGRRLAEKVVTVLKSNATGRRMLGFYRTLRDRNSASA